MDPILVARREATRDQHDHAWEVSPEGKGTEFAAAMAAIVEALKAITVEAGDAPAEGDVDLAKTWRYLGEAWFDLARVQGAPARAAALAAFERGVAALGGRPAREDAPLTVGRANAKLGLAGGHDVKLLREAIALYEEALPKVRAEFPDDVSGVERSLGHARSILTVASTYRQVEKSQVRFAASAEKLKSVEHEPGEMPQDRQVQLAMNSSISEEAVVAQTGNAVASFIAVSDKAGIVDRQGAAIAELKRMVDKLGKVSEVDPKAVRSHEQELEELNQIREALAAEFEASRVSPIRRVQLEEILDEIEGILMMKAGAPLAAQSRMGRMLRLISRANALVPESLDERLAGLHRAIKELAMRPELSPDDAEESQRLYALAAGLAPELHAATTTGKPSLHESRLRTLAVDVQRHLRRHNLMVAEPLWDCAGWPRDPDALFFAGAEDIEAQLAELCSTRGIRLLIRPRGGDEGQHRWDQLRSAGAAVFDLRGEPGPTLAATYYELGLAMNLGVPWVLMCGERQVLPFDVEESPIALRGDDYEEDRLAAAIDLAYGRPYQGEEAASMRGTLDAAIRLIEADGKMDCSVSGAVELARQADKTCDATLLASALRTLLRRVPGHRMQIFYPNQVPLYPQPNTCRVFHVMPFNQPWSAAAMRAVESVCTRVHAVYVRGDRPEEARVLRSIWNEMGLATHVLVDVTGFNLNVAFEMGLAHARGRKTLLVVRGTDGRAGVFPNIAKLQVRPYRDDTELVAFMERFVA